jgi:hypothetical protein
MLSEDLYRSYPRHVGIGVAILSIEKAMTRLRTIEAKYLKGEDPDVFLARKVREFAESPAGNMERLTPHPSTWFNQSRYLDDPKEWWARDPKEIERMKQLSAY